MRKLIRSSTLAVLLATGLLLAACGGGDDGDTGATETEAPATEATEEMTGAAVETGTGVTAEPCPEAVNEDNGCIYLGVLSDLTEGPFAPLAVPITDAQEAFWQRVNENGGIGGEYDVNISEYTRDNKYNPEVHNQLYQEIKPNILALAQTLGSPTTAAIIDDMIASDVVGAPASWTSLWDTEEPGTHIVESGNPYCVESMNGVDYYAEQNDGVDSVMAIYNPGDYGEDGAAGAKLAAEAHGAEFTAVEQTPIQAGGTTTAAIDAVVNQSPDVVVVTTPPTALGEIVGGAAAGGFEGRVIGNGPSWNPALLESPAAEALQALYWQVGPWQTFTADTPAHQAMREALGEDVQPNDGYTSGWGWSYPMLAALEQAYENGSLTREGMVEAVTSLETVDYEGMLPEEAGTFTGGMNEQVFKQTVISAPDTESASGISSVEEFYQGSTVSEHDFTGACYQTVDLEG